MCLNIQVPEHFEGLVPRWCGLGVCDFLDTDGRHPDTRPNLFRVCRKIRPAKNLGYMQALLPEPFES